MAAGGYDGTLRFDTSIDKTGFSNDLKDLGSEIFGKVYTPPGGTADAATNAAIVADAPTAVEGVTAAVTAIGTALSVILGIVVAIVAVVVALGVLFVGIIKTVGELALRMWNFMKNLIDQMAGSMSWANEYTKEVLKIKSMFEGVQQAVYAAFSPLVTFALPYITMVTEALVRMLNVCAMILATILGQATAMQYVVGSTNAAYQAAQNALAPFDELNVLAQGTSPNAGAGVIIPVPVPDTYRVALDAIKQLFIDLVDAVLALFMNLLTGVMTMLSSIILAYLGLFGGLIGSIVLFLVQLVTAIVTLVIQMVTAIWTYIVQMAMGIWTFWITVANAIWTFIVTIWNGILTFWGNIWHAITTFVTNMWTAITTFCAMVVTAFQNLFRTGDIGAFLVAIWNAFATWFVNVFNAWATFFTNIWNAITTFFGTVIGAWGTFFSTIWGAITTWFSTWWTATVTYFSSVTAAAWTFIANIIGAVVTFIGNIVTTFGRFLANLWQAVTTWAASVTLSIQTFAASTTTAFHTFFDTVGIGWGNFLNFLKNAWENIWFGIATFGTTVLNSIIDIINTMVAAVVTGINAILTAYNAIPGLPNIGLLPGYVIPHVSLPVRPGSGTGPQIPYIPIAEGALIPPNAAFLALMGDQKTGTNIETPETLMRQIVREEAGNANGQNVTINFAGSMATLVRAMKPYIDKENARIGTSLIKRAVTTVSQ